MKGTFEPGREEEELLQRFIKDSLQEDIGSGDHSTLSCIDPSSRGEAELLIKEDAVLAGLEVAERILKELDPEVRTRRFAKDGEHVKKGEVVMRAEGKVHALLAGERLLLNCMQRMSGIATLSARFVQEVSDLPVKINDTRKTTPGLRFLEKWAVRIGGGENHRHGLYDMILLKDNHIDHCGGVEKALSRAREYVEEKAPGIPIEVEARDLDELEQILRNGPVDRIMLDNFSFPDLRKAVERVNGQAITEASGGITLDSVRRYAECGVDRISVGALTHSAPSIDMSFKATSSPS